MTRSSIGFAIAFSLLAGGPVLAAVPASGCLDPAECAMHLSESTKGAVVLAEADGGHHAKSKAKSKAATKAISTDSLSETLDGLTDYSDVADALSSGASMDELEALMDDASNAAEASSTISSTLDSLMDSTASNME
ncbi:MAG: hypothetical protein AAGL23_05755 [Pseudomonadota bacterium]